MLTGASVSDQPFPRADTVLRQVRRRLVPFAFLCYVAAYIDRVNIGFAATELQRDLGLSSGQYGFGAGLFFLGYCLFEIPSNLLLEKVGARRWIARIMIGWGLVSTATMFVADVWSFMAARTLLGIAEAGFFPGMIVYLTYWIPAADRARAGALFMMAAPVAVIIGAPLSEALLKLDGTLGLKGWQWLFLVEGLPSVVLGFLSLRVLTDRPEAAGWLREDDRRWLAGVMAAERATRESVGLTSIRRSFSSGRVWLLCTVFFLNSVVNYGMFLWLPRLLRDVTGAQGFTLSAITALPFVAALISMVVVGRHSDRTGERRVHVAACAAVTALGLLVAVASQRHPWILVLGFTIAQMGLRSLAAVFWAMPPQLLGGRSAAASIALINALGGLGGFVGPTIIGVLLDATGGYTGGLLALTGALIVEAALVLAVRLPTSALPRSGGQAADSRTVGPADQPTSRPADQPTSRLADERTAETILMQRRTTMGLTPDSFQSVRFSQPQRIMSADLLMQIAADVGAAGAHGGMTDITFEWARRTRQMKEDLDMYLEIQTFLPRPDADEFEHAVRVAREAGATSLRVVCLLGRRYELMATLDDWKRAVAGFHQQIETALPIVERHKMPLGIENHKDWRVDQQVALLEHYSSEYLGVCLDTGNNLAVLDDPVETVEKLAPWTFNVHFKDMAMEECDDGFLLSEVPLGDGMLDLPRIVDIIRQARPEVRFSLEMITRDPLLVPCLTDRYWASFDDDKGGRDLARMLTRIRGHQRRAPLPRIAGLDADERRALEGEMVERSIRYAREHLGLV